MHIAICDDEEFFRKSLIEQLNKYSIEKGLDFLYYEYKDGVDLLASKIDFDIIFMDFQMKDKNGIDTVSALRQRNNNTHVIFASSYKDVVFDSLKVKTFRFLIKPIEKEKLYEALNSLIREKTVHDFIVFYGSRRLIIRTAFERYILKHPELRRCR